MNVEKMKKMWGSAIVARDQVGVFSGGLLTPRTLANLDSLGKGPGGTRVGKKIVYDVDDLCDWLVNRYNL